MKTAVQLRLRATPLLFLCGAIAVVGGCSRLAGDPLAKIRELHEKNQYRDSLDMLRALQDKGLSDLETHYLMGKALMRSGEPSLEIWSLRRAVESPEYVVDAGV